MERIMRAVNRMWTDTCGNGPRYAVKCEWLMLVRKEIRGGGTGRMGWSGGYVTTQRVARDNAPKCLTRLLSQRAPTRTKSNTRRHTWKEQAQKNNAYVLCRGNPSGVKTV